MPKKKKRKIDWKRWLIPSVIGLAIAVLGSSAIAGAATGTGSRILIDLGDDVLGRLIQMMDESVRGERATALGGTSHISGPLDSASGYYVNGTEVIDSSRNYSGGTAAFSATSTNSSIVQVDALRFGGSGVKTFDCANASSSAADVCNYSIWRIAAESDTTFGLPDATSTMSDCIKAAGGYKRILLENYSTTSAVYITVIAQDTRYSVKTDFKTASTTPTAVSNNNDIVATNEFAYLDFWNGPSAGGTSTVVILPLRDVD